MGTFGHEWEEIQGYQAARRVVADLAANLEWLEFTPHAEGIWFLPFGLLVHEGEDCWIGADVCNVCAYCGAFLVSDRGGDYIAVVGGSQPCHQIE